MTPPKGYPPDPLPPVPARPKKPTAMPRGRNHLLQEQIDLLKTRVADLEEIQLIPAELAVIAGVPPSTIREWKTEGLYGFEQKEFVQLRAYTNAALVEFVRAVWPEAAVAHLADLVKP